MKSLSSSIVVLAGAILLAGGSLAPHADTGLFVQIVGCLVGVAGLVGWYAAWRSDTPQHGE